MGEKKLILHIKENGKISLPCGDGNSRRMSHLIVEELSMFSITESGKFEGVGAHDDLVMGLALANAATQTPTEAFMLLDDMEIFDAPNLPQMGLPQGIMGLNF